MSTAPLDVLVEAIAEAVARRLAEQRPATPAEATAPPAETEWLDTKAAAKYLGIAPKTLQEWREKGEGPPAHRLGRRAIRYARTELEAFARRGRA
jgi:predicted DNA-binding transcriptional regulator AlpA